MRRPALFRGRNARDEDTAPGPAQGAAGPPLADAEAAGDQAPRASRPGAGKRRSARAAASAARLDELEGHARFARERFELYKAKAYGPRLTSPGRLRELERESERTQAALRFAQAQAAREAETERDRDEGEPGPDQARVRATTG